MEPVRVIVISSVRPEPTSAGQIILHRHLINRPEIHCEIYGREPEKFHWRIADRRLSGRLGRTRFHRWAADFGIWRAGRWLDRYLPPQLGNTANTVVLTVAHGDASGAAKRFAKKHGLPLATIFHDWWPDMVGAHKLFRKFAEAQFRELYQDSKVALCVSEGMCQTLGQHPNAHVLFPIPANRREAAIPANKGQSGCFRVLYSGNLHEYGPMLQGASEGLREHPRLRLEVRGANPQWTSDFKRKMAAEGLWLEFAPRKELDDWLASADAFLIPMVFDASMRRRMETSFPSKLTEFAQYGKPLIVWGPESCSAIKWAADGNKALMITEPRPLALVKRLEQLAESPLEIAAYREAAKRAAEGDFNPKKLQHEFIHRLQGVFGSW